MVKGAKGSKVKVLSKDYTWHVSFLSSFIILKFVFRISSLTLHVKYKCILTINGWKHDKRNQGHQSKSHFPRITHDTCHFYVGL